MTDAKTLRILHFAKHALPLTVGGSEIFLHNLARESAELGHCVVCSYHHTPEIGEPVGEYVYDGVKYRVLPPQSRTATRSEVALRHSPDIPGFAELLDDFRPDIIHLHDFSAVCGNTHLALARSRGIRTVMTYHSPGQSCQQRELLFAGHMVCDGKLILERCAKCRLMTVGIPRIIADPVSRISIPLISADSTSPFGRLASARRVTKLTLRGWEEMLDKLDLLHCHAKWVFDMLHLNHVPLSKLRFLGTGLPRPATRIVSEPDPQGRLRVAFLGRGDRIKGLESLIRAVKLLPNDAKITVALFVRFSDRDYEYKIRGAIKGDTRFLPPELISPTELHRVWANIDILAVPSIWLETGPLVVLEAFAAGVPVLGSRLGGISELVREGVDGLLHEPGDPTSIANALRRLIGEQDLLPQLRNGIRPPRTLVDLARELIPEYQRLLN